MILDRTSMGGMKQAVQTKKTAPRNGAVPKADVIPITRPSAPDVDATA